MTARAEGKRKKREEKKKSLGIAIAVDYWDLKKGVIRKCRGLRFWLVMKYEMMVTDTTEDGLDI